VVAVTSAVGETSVAVISRTLLMTVALAVAFAAPAAAQDEVDRAADALRSDPVYVSPDAERAGEVDAAALRARISAAGAAPMYIAVLPESAVQGSPGRTLIALRNAVGVSGTYALAVGDEFRTLSNEFDAAEAGEAARAAHPDDLQATLIQFIDAAGAASSDSGSGGLIASLFALAVLIAVAVGGAFLLVSRRRKRAGDGRSEARRPDLGEDFVRLGDGIRALELDVTLTENPAAKADYDRAVDAYDRANGHNRKGEEAAADRALDEGLAAIGAAQERLAGRRPR